ncbi:MAG: hypothetical protein LBV49_07500 [Azonexus sp.]|jgi:hypothetical protein|nr:hypothetical protein [Azonexus sp.]
MSQPAPAPVAPLPSSGPKLAANQTLIRGRILEVKRTENAVYTDVVLPAPDQYSQPNNVRIVSSRLLGKPGEDLTQLCQVKGYRRRYTDKHGETGYAVDVSLSALDE